MLQPSSTILEKPYDAIIKTRPKSLFYVHISDIVNPLGFSFEQGAGHPFTESMIEYGQNRNLSSDASFMVRFYNNFKPLTLNDAFCHTSACEYLKSHFVKNYTVPWLETMPMGGFGEGLMASEGSHFVGPVSSEFLFKEFQRLKRIYDSIETMGFDASKQSDTIRGYFLKYGSEYRFVIVGGNHRVGVLSALNHRRVPVAFHPDRPHVVDYAKRYTWLNASKFDDACKKHIFFTLFFKRQYVLKKS